MRNILKEFLKPKNKITYLIAIETPSKEWLYFITGKKLYEYKGQFYHPKSGLTIEKYKKNDSALDELVISGFFQDGGIEFYTDLNLAKVEIYIKNNDTISKYTELYVGNVLKDKNQFRLSLIPITYKLLLQPANAKFSATCRATFCDKLCGLKKDDYPANTSCDKTLATCATTFNNAINFRGEPDVN